MAQLSTDNIRGARADDFALPAGAQRAHANNQISARVGRNLHLHAGHICAILALLLLLRQVDFVCDNNNNRCVHKRAS